MLNNKNTTFLATLAIIAIILSCGIYISYKRSSQMNYTTKYSDQPDNLDYDIKLSDYRFDTNEIKAKPGQMLRIHLTSQGEPHNLQIDALGFDSGYLNNGQSKIVQLNIPVDAKGTYDFYCGYMDGMAGSHRKQGMVGRLNVV